MDPRIEKWVRLLYSRKFWFLLISLLIASGLVQTSDIPDAEVVNAWVVVVGGIGAVFGFAIEDGLRALADALKQAKEAGD